MFFTVKRQTITDELQNSSNLARIATVFPNRITYNEDEELDGEAAVGFPFDRQELVLDRRAAQQRVVVLAPATDGEIVRKLRERTRKTDF